MYWLARTLLWVGWDMLFQTVGWSIGWLVLRAVTFGHVPHFGFTELEQASWWYGLLVEFVGLATLGALVWYLSGLLPSAAIT
jgi:hypothetical protein